MKERTQEQDNVILLENARNYLNGLDELTKIQQTLLKDLNEYINEFYKNHI